MTQAEIEKKIKYAEENLKRKLEWVSRFDGRVAFVAGISIAMLGVLANASGLILKWDIGSFLAFASAAVLLFFSLIFIYFSQYPKIESSNSSLIFFGTIARMKFTDFKSRFEQQSDIQYLEDLLCQTHINAEILQKKFANLRAALRLIVFAIIPWVVALYLSKMYLK